MSAIVMMGKSVPYGRPVAGFSEAGPVEPLQPPITLEQMTKYLSVSSALPGPIIMSHQPARRSLALWRPATCASPDRAWVTRMALSLRALSLP